MRLLVGSSCLLPIRHFVCVCVCMCLCLCVCMLRFIAKHTPVPFAPQAHAAWALATLTEFIHKHTLTIRSRSFPIPCPHYTLGFCEVDKQTRTLSLVNPDLILSKYGTKLGEDEREKEQSTGRLICYWKWKKTQQERFSYQYNSMPVLNYNRYDLNITLSDIIRGLTSVFKCYSWLYGLMFKDFNCESLGNTWHQTNCWLFVSEVRK